MCASRRDSDQKNAADDDDVELWDRRWLTEDGREINARAIDFAFHNKIRLVVIDLLGLLLNENGASCAF
jgi:hypothetical protein